MWPVYIGLLFIIIFQYLILRRLKLDAARQRIEHEFVRQHLRDQLEEAQRVARRLTQLETDLRDMVRQEARQPAPDRRTHRFGPPMQGRD